MRLLLAARLSQLQSDGSEGIGLDTQDKRGREWAEHEGHEIIAIAADTKSGTVAPWDRKNLRPWVTDPGKMALYDGVLAYKTDRMSRGTQEDFTRIEMWATEHGKRLVIVNGPQYPARNDGDYWQWTSEKRTARTEWELGQERSVRAQRELKERGKLVGRVPFGFEVTGSKYDKAMTPTDEGRKYIPEIFRRVIAGDSLATVARWLEAEGVSPVGIASRENTAGKSGKWWPRTVGEMIRNPVYIGHRVDGSGKTVHRCESLVDAATFRAAGEALDGRPKKGPTAADNRALLSGAIFCGRGDCTAGGADSPMYRIHSKDGWFYRCAGRGAARKGCGNRVPVEVADAAMNAIAAEWFSTPVLETRIERGHDHKAELAALKFEMRQLSARDLTWEEEDAERARLRAEYDRVEALPSVPDRVVQVETGQTYAALYEALTVPERGGWLKEKGLAVCATNRAMWFRESTPAVLSMLTRIVNVPAAPTPFGEFPGGVVTDTVTDHRQLIYGYPAA